MRALSLTQPWASLVALGAKRIETRSWETSYRGPLAIHAAKACPPDALALGDTEPFRSALAPLNGIVPVGGILATCRLVHVGRILLTPRGWRISGSEWLPETLEITFGNYAPGRYAWVFADIVALPEPIACRGHLGLWEWEGDSDASR